RADWPAVFSFYSRTKSPACTWHSLALFWRDTPGCHRTGTVSSGIRISRQRHGAAIAAKTDTGIPPDRWLEPVPFAQVNGTGPDLFGNSPPDGIITSRTKPEIWWT